MSAYLRKHPFLPMAIFFIAGILSAGWFAGSPLLYYLMAGSFFTLALIISSFKVDWGADIQAVLFFLILFLFGICRTKQQYRENQPRHYSHSMEAEKNEVIGVVLESNQNRMLLKVEQINRKQVEGKLSLFSEIPLEVGDRIVAQAKIGELAQPKNPFEFNFKKYYHYKQVWYQGNLLEKPLVLNQSMGFRYRMHQLRTSCQAILRKFLITDNEYALAQALILGDKRNMGDEIKNAYADTGAMHVLAVSGLHVGVVYMILLFVFRSVFPPKKLWRYFRSFVVLLALWFFVYLVGSPASAWRAALMFSLFELGLLASRNYYPVNTLSLAAFILLLLDTNSLFDVGFQLSFLAVLGIVTCQQRIQQVWQIDHPVGFKIWQMVSLSLSAQVFTFPLTVFYFHQFPIYFWLSGILAVPFAFLVLLFGILTLLFFWVPGLNYLLGSILFGSAYLLNTWIFLVQKLPGMVVEGIWITNFQFLTLLLIAGAFAFFLIQFNRRSFQYLIISVALFMVATNLKRWNQLHQRLLIGYHDRSAQFVDLIIGNRAIPLYADNLDSESSEKVENLRSALGITAIGEAGLDDDVFGRGGFYAYRQHRIYIQDSSFLGFDDFPDISYVFLNKAPKTGSERDLEWNPLFCVSTVSDFNTIGYEHKLKELGYRTFNILREGALLVELTD